MRFPFLSTLFLSCLLCLQCGGGSSLSGDGDEDGRLDDNGETGSDYVDRPNESYDVPADRAEDIRPDMDEQCRPMDAAPDGPCTAELPGFVWNGESCGPLGSGCACAGSDCASVYDTVAHCVEDRIECYNFSCEPRGISEDACLFDCEPGHMGYFWNGRTCFDFIGCGCLGDGCSDSYRSPEECEAVHAGCEASLCRSSGGMWFTESAGLCGFKCGALEHIACESPFDSCRCEPGRTYNPGIGCVDDGCTIKELCKATLGQWHHVDECHCYFVCGLEALCDDCPDEDVCNCGPHRNYDPALGCVPDEGCAPASDEEKCEATGGEWQDAPMGCGHYQCGMPNTFDECIAPGCDCGRLMNFDSTHGCVYDDACGFRDLMETCSGWAVESTCRKGLVCCAHCAIPGCFWCDNPCCPEDDYCMDDGCPPPPP